MFTGIITHLGTVIAIEERGGDRRIAIRSDTPLTGLTPGASVACAGICLTTLDPQEDTFHVDVSAETLRRTTAGTWRPGTRVNLERALRMGDELSGHLVSGHVDAVATVRAITSESRSRRLDVACPAAFMPYMTAKGSVCLDGVSLTVNAVDDAAGLFAVNIIPHTWQATTLGSLHCGDGLNVEVDLLARYVRRLLESSP